MFIVTKQISKVDNGRERIAVKKIIDVKESRYELCPKEDEIELDALIIMPEWYQRPFIYKSDGKYWYTCDKKREIEPDVPFCTMVDKVVIRVEEGIPTQGPERIELSLEELEQSNYYGDDEINGEYDEEILLGELMRYGQHRRTFDWNVGADLFDHDRLQEEDDQEIPMLIMPSRPVEWGRERRRNGLENSLRLYPMRRGEATIDMGHYMFSIALSGYWQEVQESLEKQEEIVSFFNGYLVKEMMSIFTTKRNDYKWAYQ